MLSKGKLLEGVWYNPYRGSTSKIILHAGLALHSMEELSVESSFQSHIATAMVMEGLTFYMSEEQNLDIFFQLTELVVGKGTKVHSGF